MPSEAIELHLTIPRQTETPFSQNDSDDGYLASKGRSLRDSEKKRSRAFGWIMGIPQR